MTHHTLLWFTTNEFHYVPEVTYLHFEVYCDLFVDSFPVSVFYLDESANEYPQGNNPCPDIGELVETDGVLDVEFLEQEEFDGLDTCTCAGNATIAWFAECWQDAGGRNFPLKTTISLHDADICDDGRYYNLVRADWAQVA